MWQAIWNWLFQTKKTDVSDSFDSPYRTPGEKDDWIAPPLLVKEPPKPNAFIEWLKKMGKFLMNNWGELVFAVIVVGVLSFGAWMILLAATASDTFTHCYISYHDTTEDNKAAPFHLMGALEMDNDTTIGKFTHMNFAIEAAENINCPLK